MARKTWQQWSDEIGPVTVQGIMDGKHDEGLDILVQAAKNRLKIRFRPGMIVTLKGTKNVQLEGKQAVITKVNQKTISIGIGEKDEWGLYSEGEYNVSPGLLEVVA